MSKPEICRWCKYWDIDAKFHLGMGGSGKCHCKYCGDVGPTETCSHYEYDDSKTEEIMNELYKRYGF